MFKGVCKPFQLILSFQSLRFDSWPIHTQPANQAVHPFGVDKLVAALVRQTKVMPRRRGVEHRRHLPVSLKKNNELFLHSSTTLMVMEMR